jgi:adenine-specific DNA-methyltransferase
MSEQTSLPIDTIIQGDALEVMQTLPDASVDAIVTDPPYFKVKGDQAWDRQWDKPEHFLAWIDALCVEWKRLLKPNGSLYVFASPRMAARVEGVISKHFHILNQIVWRKAQGTHLRAHKEGLRSFFPITERIIFAEHHNSDSSALRGSSSYAASYEAARGFVFEPIRAYLENERRRAGIEREACNVVCQTRSMAARHFFTASQWCLPTKEQYMALQRLFNEQGRKPASQV